MGVVRTPFDLFSLGPKLDAMLESKKAEKKTSQKSKASQNEVINSAEASGAFVMSSFLYSIVI
jgi:hypothetical protein